MTVLTIITAFLVLDFGVLHTYLSARPQGQAYAIRRSIVHLILAWVLAIMLVLALGEIAPPDRWTATAWAIALILPAIVSWAIMQIAQSALSAQRTRHPRLPRPVSRGQDHLHYGGHHLSR